MHLFAPLLPNPRSQSCSWITEAGALTTQLQQTRAWQNSGTPPDTPDSARCDLGVADRGCRAQRRWWVRVSGTEPGFPGVPYLKPFTPVPGPPGERAACWSGGNVLDTSDTAQRLEHSLADQLVITTIVIFTVHTWGGGHQADSGGGAGEWSPSSWHRWHQAPFLAQHWLWWPWGPARGQASAPQGRWRRTASARVLGCGCRRTESENVFVLPPAQ